MLNFLFIYLSIFFNCLIVFIVFIIIFFFTFVSLKKPFAMRVLLNF